MPDDLDWIVDRSFAQKALRVEKLRAELAELGYMIVPRGEMTMTDEQIKHMVDRFLMWKLPADINPDGGITVDISMRPVGTNLLSAIQADAMVRHMVEGMPDDEILAVSTPSTCEGKPI